MCLGIRVGTAWPSMAERTVMAIKAEKAAVKTRRRSCRIAIRQATRKVLSPISEKRIMVKARKREWRGEITAGSWSGVDDEGVVVEEVLSERIEESLGEDGFSGCGMS